MKSLASPRVVAEIRERLLRLTPEDCALWGKMSVTEMVRHLDYAYDVALADRSVGAVPGPPQWLLKFAALRLPMQWPKGTPTTQELVVALGEECPLSFGKIVTETIEKVEAVASGTRWQPSHPFFGKMSAKDWMRWGYLHADHHLRQFGR